MTFNSTIHKDLTIQQGKWEHLVKDATDMVESHQLQQGEALLVQSSWRAHRNTPETHPMGSKTKHKNLRTPPTNPTGLRPTSYVILADWVSSRIRKLMIKIQYVSETPAI
jgi:tRNA U34 5-methylaminomethyl-2-thiouridine-forming methyltransferase MnmC